MITLARIEKPFLLIEGLLLTGERISVEFHCSVSACLMIFLSFVEELPAAAIRSNFSSYFANSTNGWNFGSGILSDSTRIFHSMEFIHGLSIRATVNARKQRSHCAKSSDGGSTPKIGTTATWNPFTKIVLHFDFKKSSTKSFSSESNLMRHHVTGGQWFLFLRIFWWKEIGTILVGVSHSELLAEWGARLWVITRAEWTKQRALIGHAPVRTILC